MAKKNQIFFFPTLSMLLLTPYSNILSIFPFVSSHKPVKDGEINEYRVSTIPICLFACLKPAWLNIHLKASLVLNFGVSFSGFAGFKHFWYLIHFLAVGYMETAKEESLARKNASLHKLQPSSSFSMVYHTSFLELIFSL